MRYNIPFPNDKTTRFNNKTALKVTEWSNYNNMHQAMYLIPLTDERSLIFAATSLRRREIATMSSTV